MAHFNQEKKAKIAPQIKALLKEYNLKGSLSIDNGSTIVLTIKSGDIDFIGDYNRGVEYDNRGRNPGDFAYRNYAKDNLTIYYLLRKENFSGDALNFLSEAMRILNTDNFDHSDSQTDYFHVGHYVNIKIGDYQNPYICTKPQTIKEAA